MTSIGDIKRRYEKAKDFKERMPETLFTRGEVEYVEHVGRLLEEREAFLQEMESVLEQAKDGQPVWALGLLETRINQERRKG